MIIKKSIFSKYKTPLQKLNKEIEIKKLKKNSRIKKIIGQEKNHIKNIKQKDEKELKRKEMALKGVINLFNSIRDFQKKKKELNEKQK